MLTHGDDLLVFRAADEEPPSKRPQQSWKVLVVDDEREVHAITSLVLRDLVFEGKGIEFFHAYSAEEARQVLALNHGIAVIFLDVVMEHQHAGLDLVRWIREEHKDSLVRIILRTGQPGAAPERDVIIRYDINDYKEKTELTDIKLWTAMVVALRGFRDLSIISRSRNGLEKIVQASITFTERQSLNQFFQGVLTQLTSLLPVEDDSVLLRAEGMAVQRSTSGMFRIISGTGTYETCIGQSLDELGNARLLDLVQRGSASRESFFDDSYYVGYMRDEDGSENLIILHTPMALDFHATELIRVFISNASIALINVSLNRAIEISQGDMIFTLGEVVESRSIETGNHVKRVAAVGALLGSRCGLSPQEVDHLRYALPLHDIGKIAIPDAVLNKPGPLSPEEMLEMRKHTLIGFNLLHGGNQRSLQLASTIALTHHERWDGKGYPQGLAGADIPLVGRITCIVDVVDALLHSRVYKPSWDWLRVEDYLRENKGKQFDPELVEVYLSSLDEIKSLLEGFQGPA